MTYFLVNPRFPCAFAEKLRPFGECIAVSPLKELCEPVCAHPDMLAVNINGKLFIHEKDISLRRTLEKLGLPFSLSHADVSEKYPRDIALNLFTMEKCLFANLKYASADVLEYASSCGYELVNVAQGYAKCSTMTVQGGIITADKTIYNAALSKNIDALLISQGYVGIERYDTGFIGGASAEIAHGKVVVFGDINSHPDSAEILRFAKEHDTEILNLGNGPLFDYGGIVCANA